MNAEFFLGDFGRKAGRTEMTGAVEVFIAYGDLADGQRAMQVLADLDKGLGGALDFRASPWSFELLINANWGDVATNAALESDILMIAASTTHRRGSDVQEWIENILLRKRGTEGAIVALLSNNTERAGAASLRLHDIQAAAQRAGLAFFTPDERRPFTKAVHGTHPGQPNYRPPRWGINE